MYIELDKKLIEDIEKITMETFDKKDNLIPAGNIEETLKNLLHEIDKLKEQIEDEIEQRENYYKPKSEYELLGMSERDFI